MALGRERRHRRMAIRRHSGCRDRLGLQPLGLVPARRQRAEGWRYRLRLPAAPARAALLEAGWARIAGLKARRQRTRGAKLPARLTPDQAGSGMRS